jgi:hypothetical protein
MVLEKRKSFMQKSSTRRSLCRPGKKVVQEVVKLSTTSRFVPLFLAYGNVVVGFAIFHIAYSKKKKKEKKKEKKALLHGM